MPRALRLAAQSSRTAALSAAPSGARYPLSMRTRRRRCASSKISGGREQGLAGGDVVGAVGDVAVGVGAAVLEAVRAEGRLVSGARQRKAVNKVDEGLAAAGARQGQDPLLDEHALRPPRPLRLAHFRPLGLLVLEHPGVDDGLARRSTP